MKLEKGRPARLRYLVPVAAMALIAVAAITPASAGDADYKGWYGVLDLALTQPNSLDQHYANHIDDSGSFTRVERLTFDNDDDFTFRAAIGYSWGGMGRLQVAYWSFDNDENEDGTKNGGLYPTIFGYSFDYGGFYPYNSSGLDFEAESSVEASTWDIDYIRPIPVGDRFTVSWLAGLRVAQYEESRAVVITDGNYSYLQEKGWEADAIGLRVGAQAEFEFTDRFAIQADLAVSFLQADLDGKSRQGTNFSGLDEVRIADDDNVRGEIREYGVKAVFNTGPVDLFIGYGVQSWDGLVADPLPPNEGGHFALGPAAARDRDTISFNSITGGAKWRFGGGS